MTIDYIIEEMRKMTLEDISTVLSAIGQHIAEQPVQYDLDDEAAWAIGNCIAKATQIMDDDY